MTACIIKYIITDTKSCVIYGLHNSANKLIALHILLISTVIKIPTRKAYPVMKRKVDKQLTKHQPISTIEFLLFPPS